MKHLLTGITIAIALLAATPVWPQALLPQVWQPQSPFPAYPNPNYYRFVAPTPEDAYRQGLINRWELEQLTGPTPQALQGPSPNGNKGGDFK